MASDPGSVPPFRFMGLRHVRHGTYVGFHQSEGMALLAQLVALRLRHPYVVKQL